MMINDRVAGWRSVVPVPLARAAAAAMCMGEGEPCESCVGEAAAILAYAYAYNDRATEEQPCLACELVRTNPNAIYANCLFHMGVYQGVTSGLKAPEEAIELDAPSESDPTLPVSVRRWRWRYVALAVIVVVTAIYLAIGVYFTVRLVK